MTHSPATVLRRRLIDQGIIGLHTSKTWPSDLQHMPDAEDDHVTLYDSIGEQDGRIFRTKEVIERPGIQVRVRSRSFENARKKVDEIAADFDSILRAEVTVESSIYQVHSVIRTIPIPSGQEDAEKTRRNIYTLNALVVIKQTQ